MGRPVTITTDDLHQIVACIIQQVNRVEMEAEKQRRPLSQIEQIEHRALLSVSGHIRNVANQLEGTTSPEFPDRSLTHRQRRRPEPDTTPQTRSRFKRR